MSKDRRNNSIALLKEKLIRADMPKPAVAPISITLSKGRSLLIGRHASALDIVARLLTASTPLDESVERLGRGWSVVTRVAFESYEDRISKMHRMDAAKYIASDVLESVQNESFSHFHRPAVSMVDRLLWMILKCLLADVEDNLVALIVNTMWPLTNNTPNVDQVTHRAKKVRKRFQMCRFMYLDLPALKNGDVPDVVEKKKETSRFTLNVLKKTLCSSTAPRVEISIDNKSDQEALLKLLASFLLPVIHRSWTPSINSKTERA